MDNLPRGLIVKPRDSDYVLGSTSPLDFKGVTNGDWTSYFNFNENQKNALFDNDGCACYSANKILDAWMDFLWPSLSPELVKSIEDMGFMDSNSIDGKPHFHSSPRLTELSTGNGINGNSLPECCDAIRRVGAVPYAMFPFTVDMTSAEYFTPPSQKILSVGLQFLNLMGGKSFLQYHWAANGVPKNISQMEEWIKQTPLDIGVAVTNGWNQIVPTDPSPSQNPQHAVAVPKLNPPSVEISDNYIPYKKNLDINYPINYVLQIAVSPIAPLPQLPAHATNSQISVWLSAVSRWLSSLLSNMKGRELQGNTTMNFSDLLSLNWNDAKKAAVMAVLTPVVGYVYQVVTAGSFMFDGNKLLSLAIAGFVGYLAKNFFSTPDGAVLGVIGKPKA